MICAFTGRSSFLRDDIKKRHLSQIAGIMGGFLDEVTPKLNLEL